jgi:DNA-binding GntR family transcriptional regulator
MTLRTIEFKGKRGVLVQQLREAIVSGQFAVGERLRQEDLAARFGVSTTPVREALRVLEAQGLVTYEADRGVTVADLAGTFDQVYRLREALECLAVEMAAQNMTDERADALIRLANDIERFTSIGDQQAVSAAHREFHLVLYGGCNFSALVEMIELVWARFPWDELLALPGFSTARDHLEIAQAVAARDPRAAASSLRRHFLAVRRVLNARLNARVAASTVHERSRNDRPLGSITA